MEHVALMEQTLQVGMPRSFAMGRDARSFFTRAGACFDTTVTFYANPSYNLTRFP